MLRSRYAAMRGKFVRSALLGAIFPAIALLVFTLPGAGKEIDSPLKFKVEDIDGNEVDLGRYLGTVTLIVNTASKCGLTPQYEALQKVYEKYREQGFTILAFPANNFGGQEPGTNAEIKSFCQTNYKVTFPLFAKRSVKGEDISPLYTYLTSSSANHEFGGEISWNFTKFLVDRDGRLVGRFEPAHQAGE